MFNLPQNDVDLFGTQINVLLFALFRNLLFIHEMERSCLQPSGEEGTPICYAKCYSRWLSPLKRELGADRFPKN